MRMGIFGGSFDPVHIGHLWIAESALEMLQLDQIRWIPVARSPLKPNPPIASDQHRLQMIRLALAGAESHLVDTCEIERGEISYTVDTIAELRERFPGAEVVLIVGSDSLATLRQWHEPERLLQLTTPAVVQRGGEKPIDWSVLDGIVDQHRIDEIRQHVIRMPVIEVSSSELRQRIADGRSIRFRTPRAVEALIQSEKLYRSETNAAE